MTNGLSLFIGGANPDLGKEVAKELGVAPGECIIEKFPDGEHHVEVLEDVRGRDVFILQSLRSPPGEHLLELLLLADAARRIGASRVVGVVPYLAFARQDRRDSESQPMGAKLMADLIGTRVDRAVVVDLHSPAVEGCFPVPVEQLRCDELLIERLKREKHPKAVVVSPDLGGVKRAERFARALKLPVAVVHKSRISGSEVTAESIVGEVRDCVPLLVDDMISTAGTMAAAVDLLLKAGAVPEITLCASHGLFVGPSLERLRKLPLRRILVTDSVPPPSDLPIAPEIVPIAPLIAGAISRIHGQRG
jgi:ribose-phosphate pyrophosphokinase